MIDCHHPDSFTMWKAVLAPRAIPNIVISPACQFRILHPLLASVLSVRHWRCLVAIHRWRKSFSTRLLTNLLHAIVRVGLLVVSWPHVHLITLLAQRPVVRLFIRGTRNLMTIGYVIQPAKLYCSCGPLTHLAFVSGGCSAPGFYCIGSTRITAYAKPLLGYWSEGPDSNRQL